MNNATCNNVDDDATVRHDKINDWIKISELEVSKRVHTMYNQACDAKLSKGADVDGEKKATKFLA